MKFAIVGRLANGRQFIDLEENWPTIPRPGETIITTTYVHCIVERVHHDLKSKVIIVYVKHTM